MSCAIINPSDLVSPIWIQLSREVFLAQDLANLQLRGLYCAVNTYLNPRNLC